MNEIKPAKIRLEASSHCQLHCPSCPTATGAIQPAVGSGFLRLAHFQRLLEDNPWVKEIELSNYGEIFLNPELLGILRCAFEHGVALTADNGANLNHVRPDVLEGLVAYNFRSMTCSIDGATQETYAQYRVRGHLETVIENVRTINRHKQAQNSESPKLAWQFVVFGNNEHEIPLARAMAHELGMEFHLKLSWDPDFSPVRDADLVRREAGAASRTQYAQLHGQDYAHVICHQLWQEPQINWDGKVLGCCRNFWGDFGGNAFEDGLLQSVNHEKMQYAREMLAGRQGARPDIPCATCEIYRSRKQSAQWVTIGPRPVGARPAGQIIF